MGHERLGSKAEVNSHHIEVSFTPNSRHSALHRAYRHTIRKTANAAVSPKSDQVF